MLKKLIDKKKLLLTEGQKTLIAVDGHKSLGAANKEGSGQREKRKLTDEEILTEMRKKQKRVEEKKSEIFCEREIGNLSRSEIFVLEWMERMVGNLKDERKKETEKAAKDLRSRMEEKKFPITVSEGLARAAKFAQDRKYKNAYEEYLSVAVGNAAWPIGVKGLQVKVRGCNNLIQPVHHVLDREENREILTAFKRLLSAAQTAAPSQDLADNVTL